MKPVNMRKACTELTPAQSVRLGLAMSLAESAGFDGTLEQILEVANTLESYVFGGYGRALERFEERSKDENSHAPECYCDLCVRIENAELEAQRLRDNMPPCDCEDCEEWAREAFGEEP